MIVESKSAQFLASPVIDADVLIPVDSRSLEKISGGEMAIAWLVATPLINQHKK